MKYNDEINIYLDLVMKYLIHLAKICNVILFVVEKREKQAKKGPYRPSCSAVGYVVNTIC